MNMTHVPVLLQEVVEGLAIKPHDVVVDATLGGAGHARALAAKLSSEGTLIGFDADGAAIERSRATLADVAARTILINANFRTIADALDANGIASIDKALFDLGLSSFQLDTSDRGFTFRRDLPLVMTLADDPGSDEVTAHDVVNTWSEGSLADIIFGFGEERYARRIARAITEAREKGPIETTFALRDLIEAALPGKARARHIHPATKTFQAIRIAVNDELGAIEEGLRATFDRLAPEGRIAVISFHSLEDRIVKRLFREKAQAHAARLLTKRPIIPSDQETQANPRARSAKLRLIEKL
jgi:16S rRNA (cytosine1402-N4)-methyltransferase